jgi:ABC-type cobalamin/Fe3+-siderophores transport system ATPase subunit
MRNNSALVLSILSVLLLCAMAASMSAGRYHIGFHDMLSVLWRHYTAPSEVADSPLHLVLFKVRLPRMCAGYRDCRVLHNVSLSIAVGEIVCLLGPNGSGKTTLFKAILGLLPFQGELSIDSRPLAMVSRRERARLLGYVPQIHVPPFPFTVLDIVLAGRTPCIGTFSAPSEKDRTLAREALKLLSIERLIERNYAQVSGGERQLVLIARALAQSPKFLILDEPTSHLDFGNQFRIIQIIRSLAKKKIGVVFTTHNPDHAFLCATKVVGLINGRIAAYGKPGEALTKTLLSEMYGIDVDVVPLSQGGCVCTPSGKGKE